MEQILWFLLSHLQTPALWDARGSLGQLFSEQSLLWVAPSRSSSSPSYLAVTLFWTTSTLGHLFSELLLLNFVSLSYLFSRLLLLSAFSSLSYLFNELFFSNAFLLWTTSCLSYRLSEILLFLGHFIAELPHPWANSSLSYCEQTLFGTTLLNQTKHRKIHQPVNTRGLAASQGDGFRSDRCGPAGIPTHRLCQVARSPNNSPFCKKGQLMSHHFNAFKAWPQLDALLRRHHSQLCEIQFCLLGTNQTQKLLRRPRKNSEQVSEPRPQWICWPQLVVTGLGRSNEASWNVEGEGCEDQVFLRKSKWLFLETTSWRPLHALQMQYPEANGTCRQWNSHRTCQPQNHFSNPHVGQVEDLVAIGLVVDKLSVDPKPVTCLPLLHLLDLPEPRSSGSSWASLVWSKDVCATSKCNSINSFKCEICVRWSICARWCWTIHFCRPSTSGLRRRCAASASWSALPFQ